MLEVWALKNWKTTAAIIAVVVLFALGGLGFWRGLVAIERLQDKAARVARDLQDAKWQAQIANANAAVERARAAQAETASRLEAQASEAQRSFETQLNELEKANAALAGGDRCGLERDRVRLLNGPKP